MAKRKAQLHSLCDSGVALATKAPAGLLTRQAVCLQMTRIKRGKRLSIFSKSAACNGWGDGTQGVSRELCGVALKFKINRAAIKPLL
jgi:hypothetical protein